MAISALFLSHYRHKYMYNAYTHVRVHVQYMCRLLLTQCARVCTCARVCDRACSRSLSLLPVPWCHVHVHMLS